VRALEKLPVVPGFGVLHSVRIEGPIHSNRPHHLRPLEHPYVEPALSHLPTPCRIFIERFAYDDRGAGDWSLEENAAVELNAVPKVALRSRDKPESRLTTTAPMKESGGKRSLGEVEGVRRAIRSRPSAEILRSRSTSLKSALWTDASTMTTYKVLLKTSSRVRRRPGRSIVVGEKPAVRSGRRLNALSKSASSPEFPL